MSNHPYPQHVIDAVAKALYPHVYKWPYDTANKALQALWNASRIDRVGQLDELPEETVIHDGYFSYEKDAGQWRCFFNSEYLASEDLDLPTHVIYWGHHD